MSHTILVVEDEEDLGNTLVFNLHRNGYQTRIARNGADALRELAKEPPPDLVLLDLLLPDLSGTEVCRRLRAEARTRHTPVIIVSAKGEEIDRVVGFEVGADDYVVKPFSVRELILRIQVLLRRIGRVAVEEERTGVVEFGILKVDPEAVRVWVESEEVELTAMEFKLLLTLMERKGRMQSRDSLLNDVWGIHSYVQSRTVDVHIKRLREKLKQAGYYIETVRGLGYRFNADPAKAS